MEKIKYLSAKQSTFLEMLRNTKFIDALSAIGIKKLPNFTANSDMDILFQRGDYWDMKQVSDWIDQYLISNSYNPAVGDADILNSIAELYKRYRNEI